MQKNKKYFLIASQHKLEFLSSLILLIDPPILHHIIQQIKLTEKSVKRW